MIFSMVEGRWFFIAQLTYYPNGIKGTNWQIRLFIKGGYVVNSVALLSLPSFFFLFSVLYTRNRLTTVKQNKNNSLQYNVPLHGQTVVTAYLQRKQLLLFIFARSIALDFGDGQVLR